MEEKKTKRTKKVKDTSKVTLQEAAEAKVEKDQPKVVKRFANHDLAFFYFLSKINPLGQVNPFNKQYQLLKQIAIETLSRMKWIGITPVEENGIIRNNFSDQEIKDIITWKLIDYHVRGVISKQSYLSKTKRQFILDIFEWVDHFVAKGDEEITMTIDNLGDYKEFAEEFLKIKEDVESSNKDIKES